MSESDQFSITSLLGKSVISHPQPDSRWVLPAAYIGVEIETERCRILNKNVLREGGWDMHPDGSLRNNGMEFTFDSPKSGTAITKALDTFFNPDLPPVSYEVNPRAGVHVHINWLEDGLSLKALRNLIVLMYCIEPAVYEWADANRKWCGYCCQLTDLPEERLRTLLTSQSHDVLSKILRDNNNNRYWGLNLAALAKFGTVEFRYFPSTASRESLESWINFVMSAKKAATEFEGDYQLLTRALSTSQGITDFLTARLPHAGIGTVLLNHLDMGAAVNRMTDLGYLVALTPARKTAVPMKSPALNKFLAKKFPQFSEVDVARNYAAVYREEAQRPMMHEDRLQELLYNLAAEVAERQQQEQV